MISGEAFVYPADGGAARSLGVIRRFRLDTGGLVESVKQYEELTVELTLADASLRALWPPSCRCTASTSYDTNSSARVGRDGSGRSSRR